MGRAAGQQRRSKIRERRKPIGAITLQVAAAGRARALVPEHPRHPRTEMDRPLEVLMQTDGRRGTFNHLVISAGILEAQVLPPRSNLPVQPKGYLASLPLSLPWLPHSPSRGADS